MTRISSDSARSGVRARRSSDAVSDLNTVHVTLDKGGSGATPLRRSRRRRMPMFDFIALALEALGDTKSKGPRLDLRGKELLLTLLDEPNEAPKRKSGTENRSAAG